MKIAITGATGFIGRHVRNALSNTDHEVVLVVRNANKVGETTAREKVVLADLGKARTDWFELFGKPDAVLHLAWGGLPNFMDTYHVDLELPMQLRFLTALVESGLKKLVITGTCYEYGMSSGALSEEQETNPNTPYGIAKDRLRKELFDLQQLKKFDLTWARVFYPYGEGQSEHSLYSLMKDRSVSCNSEFQLYNGDGVLDFISVIDLSELLTTFLITFDNAGLVNFGTGRPKSVSEFARDIAEANNWSINFVSGDQSSRNFESKCFWSNNSKLNSFLTKYISARKEFK